MLEALGYTVNTVVVNASAFVPQSRARVFLLGALGEQPLLPEVPTAAPLRLVDMAGCDGDWWSPDRRDGFLETLSPLQRDGVESWRGDDRVRSTARNTPSIKNWTATTRTRQKSDPETENSQAE